MQDVTFPRLHLCLMMAQSSWSHLAALPYQLQPGEADASHGLQVSVHPTITKQKALLACLITQGHAAITKPQPVPRPNLSGFVVC